MALMIDSSVFITMDRTGRELDDLWKVAPPGPASIAIITVSELLVGYHRANTLEQQWHRRRFIDTLFQEIPILVFDLQAARTHASLVAQLMSEGDLIGSNDLLIAATALTQGLDVLTENVRDFERVPGLTVRQPNW